MSSGLQGFCCFMSTLIQGWVVFFLDELSERHVERGVSHERTVRSSEVDRRHSNLCLVWWIVETRGEPSPARGPGEEWSVCRERTSWNCEKVQLPDVRFYMNERGVNARGSVAIKNWGPVEM